MMQAIHSKEATLSSEEKIIMQLSIIALELRRANRLNSFRSIIEARNALMAEIDDEQSCSPMQQDYPDPAPTGFQSVVNIGNRRGPMLKLRLNQNYQVGDLSFRVENIDGDLVTVKLLDGTTTTLHAPAILFSPVGLREN
ncbi:MAG: hypothetical protein WCD70_17100 [Alphaproteobacteria bacterium]